MLNYGILWINARNLSYIKKFNWKKEIRLANDKLATKKFLSERWIPFAKTYEVIKDRKQLFDIDFWKLPSENFVIKPNRWSKGKWIYVVKYLWDEEWKVNNIWWEWEESWSYIKKLGTKFRKMVDKFQKMPNLPCKYKIWGSIVSDNDFRRYILDDLDGKNSMTNWNDKVIVEEKLVPGDTFKKFCKFWLADMRIIVFNLVPVWAMVRIPTEKSGGKANLAAWGIWAGIDIWTWIIKSVYVNHKSYTKKFPEEYKHLKWVKIPYWDDILLRSSKIQYYVNLWYLALDWVITDDGPKLLEINARAGLELQNITWVKLANVLDKISDLKIKYPEKWVEIAKTLFSQEDKEILPQKILYLSQIWKLKVKSDEPEYYNEIVVKVDINKSENYVSKDIYEWIKSKDSDNIMLLVWDNDVTIKWIKFLLDKNLSENEIVLGKKVSSEFLLKPIETIKSKVSIIDVANIDSQELTELHNIDDEISEIWKKLILSSILKPQNYIDELDNFIMNNGKYNPKFTYNWPDDDFLQNLNYKLTSLQNKLSKNSYNENFSRLFDSKIEELLYRINLIRAYKKESYDDVLIYNEKIYWKLDEQLINMSKNKIFEWKLEDKSLLGNVLPMDEVKNIILNYLESIGIKNVWIQVTFSSLARINVSMWKHVRIKINWYVPFQEKEIKSVIAHEIDTHLVRYLNWSETGRKIFKEWTWFYLRDEEWLAIYNSNKYLPKNYEKLSFYKKYFLLEEAQKYPFTKLVDLVRFLYPEKEIERIFNTILKIKKWVMDTSITDNGAINFKEKVYLDWYMKTNDWMEKGNSIEWMYKGKIKLDDLNLIK